MMATFVRGRHRGELGRGEVEFRKRGHAGPEDDAGGLWPWLGSQGGRGGCEAEKGQ